MTDPSSPERKRRSVGRPAKLTRDQVARAAFDLVDAEGAAALTMPRLADELNVGTMTLYSYAESKEALVQMLPDLLLADLPAPSPGQPWVEMIENVYLSAYQRLVRHRHITQLVAHTPVFSRKQGQLVEQVVSSLQAQGFTAEAAFRLQRTAGTYTLGFAIFTVAETGATEHPREQWVSSTRLPHAGAIARMLSMPGDEDQYLAGLRAIIAGSRPPADTDPGGSLG